MKIRHHYLPISDAQPGMILGAPIILGEQGVHNFNLPAGHALTETNLQQMAIRHAEFLCIEVPDERSEAECAAENAVSEMRLQHIFRSADLSSPAMARLYKAIADFRKA